MGYNNTKDLYEQFPELASNPSRMMAAVTPNDATDLPTFAKALYIGATGDVSVVPLEAPDDTPVVFNSHPIGYMPCMVRRVMNTNTTATNIVALYN